MPSSDWVSAAQAFDATITLRPYAEVREDLVVGPSAAAYLAQAIRSDQRLQRHATLVFGLVPGSKDLAMRMANYVLDLPGPSAGRTLLSVCLDAAVTNVVKLGLVPYTISAHVDGYA